MSAVNLDEVAERAKVAEALEEAIAADESKAFKEEHDLAKHRVCAVSDCAIQLAYLISEAKYDKAAVACLNMQRNVEVLAGILSKLVVSKKA